MRITVQNAVVEFATDLKIRIEFPEDERVWSGTKRFWENVCKFVSKLPNGGRADNIFSAMKPYPDSVLVYTGLLELFGKYKKVGSTQIQSLFPATNAFSEFDPFRRNCRLVSKWYEPHGYSRIQEIVVHLTETAEYVLRCAYRACGESGSQCPAGDLLADLLRTSIALVGDEELQLVLSDTKDISDYMSDNEAHCCLKQSMQDAHEAVVRGSRVAGRRYGKKRHGQVDRQRIGLGQLRRILPEIKDALIMNLTESVTNVFANAGEDNGFDVDEVELGISRLLRKVDDLYMRLGMLHFAEELGTENSQEAMECIAAGPLYRFNPMRVQRQNRITSTARSVESRA